MSCLNITQLLQVIWSLSHTLPTNAWSPMKPTQQTTFNVILKHLTTNACVQKYNFNLLCSHIYFNPILKYETLTGFLMLYFYTFMQPILSIIHKHIVNIGQAFFKNFVYKLKLCTWEGEREKKRPEGNGNFVIKSHRLNTHFKTLIFKL